MMMATGSSFYDRHVQRDSGDQYFDVDSKNTPKRRKKKDEKTETQSLSSDKKVPGIL
jgi:hypothetical protein